MFQLNLNDEEKQNLIVAIEMAVKHHPNSLQAAAVLLPIAQKIQSAQPVEVKDDDGRPIQSRSV